MNRQSAYPPEAVELAAKADRGSIEAEKVESVPRPSGVEEPVWNNQCCRCLRVGVVNETELNAGVPITWVCMVCKRFVCIDCAECIPGKVPRELEEDTLCSLGCRQKRDSDRLVEALASVEMPAVALVLNCPACGERHVDEGVWATKLHHTHACQICGLAWRPAIVFTVGVQFLPGFKNEG